MTANEANMPGQSSLQSSRPNIFPEIIYLDAQAALAWLAQAFGFTLGEVIKGPHETIAHAEMHYGAGTIMPQSPLEESECGTSPQALGGVTQRVYMAVEDPDAHCERAKAGGAQIVWGPADTDYGARMYSARDLEGHIWSFGTYWPSPAFSPGKV